MTLGDMTGTVSLAKMLTEDKVEKKPKPKVNQRDKDEVEKSQKPVPATTSGSL
jgi:hypothetical protein